MQFTTQAFCFTSNAKFYHKMAYPGPIEAAYLQRAAYNSVTRHLWGIWVAPEGLFCEHVISVQLCRQALHFEVLGYYSSEF